MKKHQFITLIFIIELHSRSGSIGSFQKKRGVKPASYWKTFSYIEKEYFLKKNYGRMYTFTTYLMYNVGSSNSKLLPKNEFYNIFYHWRNKVTLHEIIVADMNKRGSTRTGQDHTKKEQKSDGLLGILL